MTAEERVAAVLADGLLAGAEHAGEIAERLSWMCGRRHRWIKPCAERLFARFGSRLGEAERRRVIEAICADPGYSEAWYTATPPTIRRYPLSPMRIGTGTGALAASGLPQIATPADLAGWLELPIGVLDWFADVRHINRLAEGPLCHYQYRWVSKRDGGLRLLEIPKPRLAELQRRILRGILDKVAAHDAAHGFRRTRSCRSYAAPHTNKQVVLHFDLRHFFASIPASRIHALFAHLGYPAPVARLLTGICTHPTPLPVLRALTSVDPRALSLREQRAMLRGRHLPQGAPSSPALANLCALHLDFRLAGLARALDADYTRYADDLALSGGETLRRSLRQVVRQVTAIAVEQGFSVNAGKTRAMHQSGRQMLTGIVVNQKTNPRRSDYDRLKAVLHNCLRDGAATQNRDGHLDFRAYLHGRVAHLRQLNPEKGERLLLLLSRIDWGASLPRG